MAGQSVALEMVEAAAVDVKSSPPWLVRSRAETLAGLVLVWAKEMEARVAALEAINANHR
jgi:hypothetical protein